MRRHNGSGRFHKEEREKEDINPMEGLSNLSDVMLVFACGLMLALITYWNVDVAGVDKVNADIQPPREVVEDISGLGENGGEPVNDGELEQYGMVYRDPSTGKLYLMTEGES